MMSIFNAIRKIIKFTRICSSISYNIIKYKLHFITFNDAVITTCNSLMHKNISEFDKIVKYQMDDISSMDIDTPLDWKIVEYLLTQN